MKRERHVLTTKIRCSATFPVKHIQVDEIWAFCYTKQKNVESAKKAVEGAGDIWTWTAIDAETKLVPSWFVGSRDADAAQHVYAGFSQPDDAAVSN